MIASLQKIIMNQLVYFGDQNNSEKITNKAYLALNQCTSKLINTVTLIKNMFTNYFAKN